ncbi:SDR family NAD(P)-dependent oxidoreductase [Streptomyces sp. NBC_01622]|uniref:SDR family NAD(P)-dependent oxidoreductase n=1 Tax=Streptomyces sp. NBC_01622 TaxID=2975903 RepID=UPI0038644AC8|nr:SDR family NAD(P)-dependent oxidoreductase [Streptomyces sp. NBC_01622]
MYLLRPYCFAGGTAVLTGAASGMGEQMAYGLAARGSNLVLLDRDAERLNNVAHTICERHTDVRVHAIVVDLAHQVALDNAVEQILIDHPLITLLVNNAGVAMDGRFEDLSAEEFDWMMRINFHAPVALTRRLLPVLRSHPGSHIVNVSSLFGLIAPPGQVAYASSKYALRGFSEALRHEVVAQGIGVTTVHPGGIRTRISETARIAASLAGKQSAQAESASFDKMLTYPADKAAAQILCAIEKRDARVVITRLAIFAETVGRIFPSTYWSVLSRLRPSATGASRVTSIR